MIMVCFHIKYYDITKHKVYTFLLLSVACSWIPPAPAQIASRAMRLHDADFELLKVSQLQRYQDAWSWTSEVEDVGMAQTITVETWRTTNGLVLVTIQLWLSTQFWPIAMCKFEVMLRMNNGQLKGTSNDGSNHKWKKMGMG